MRKVSLSVLVVACAVSLGVGFLLGIGANAAGRRFLAGMVVGERPADVTVAHTISRDRFALQYPSNWSVDETDEDYDPDHLFSIDSSGSTSVMFVVRNEDDTVSPQEKVDAQIEAQMKLMKAPKISRFDRFGRFAGLGATLTGRSLSVKRTVKLFAFNAEGLTVLIVQMYSDEDLPNVKDGLELIEKSFELKPAPK
jgi:hypothetical protein